MLSAGALIVPVHVHQCVSRKGIDHIIEAAIYGLELQERFVKVMPGLA